MESQVTILEQKINQWRDILSSKHAPSIEPIDFDQFNDVLGQAGEMCRDYRRLNEEMDFVRHWLTALIVSREKAIRLLNMESSLISDRADISDCTLPQLINKLEQVSGRLRQVSRSVNPGGVSQNTWKEIKNYKA